MGIVSSQASFAVASEFGVNIEHKPLPSSDMRTFCIFLINNINIQNASDRICPAKDENGVACRGQMRYLIRSGDIRSYADCSQNMDIREWLIVGSPRRDRRWGESGCSRLSITSMSAVPVCHP